MFLKLECFGTLNGTITVLQDVSPMYDFLHGVQSYLFGFVPQAELVACCDKCIASSLLQGAFEFESYSLWYEEYFGIRAVSDPIIAVVDGST